MDHHLYSLVTPKMMHMLEENTRIAQVSLVKFIAEWSNNMVVCV